MSRICRLSIKGIRNFDDESEGTPIKFSRPLTLILGPNGTGKTTIIECLRYALSGEYPPGSDKGKAFIHDPTLKKLSSVQVRGNVKAEIEDCRGERYGVSRTIQGTQNRDKFTFTTLDGVILRHDKITKKKVAYSSRCGDINVEMMSLMGVSKSILNFVLFCHQDDSNWPFETGKKLKERFDEIFETTRYNKALDCIRKLMNEKKQDMKVLTNEKKYLKVMVEEVELKRKKLRDFETRSDETKNKIKNLTNALIPINERLAQIKEIEREYSKWQLDGEKKKMEYKHATRQITDVKENIKELYNGSTTELSNEIASYDEMLREKNNKIVELERELRDFCEKETKISDRIAERRVAVGTARQQMRDQKAKIDQRNDTLKNMLAVWDLNESITSDVTESEAINLVKSFENRLHQLEQEIEAKRAEQDRQQERLQLKVNNLSTERSTIESQLANNETELMKTKGEIRANQALLKQSGAMEQQLNDVDAKLDEANRKLTELNRTLDIEGLNRKIREATAKEEELEVKSNRLDKEIIQLREQSALHIKLESCQSELVDKEKELQALKEKHGDTLRMLLGNINFSDSNMTTEINGVQDVLNKRVQNLRKEIETKQCEVMKLELSVKHQKEELEKKTSQIKSDKERLSLQCKDYTNYREVLTLHSKKIKDLEDKRGMYAYQGAAYREYIKTLSEPEPCCPLCHRDFNNSNDAKNLVTELRNDMREHPDRLRTYEKELAMQRKKYDALLQLQPIVDKIENFEETEATKMEQDIQEASENLEISRQRVKRLQDSMAEPERKLAICKGMIGDMALWDRYTDEVDMINATIVELQDQLQSAGLNTDKTMQEAEAEQNQLQQLLKKVRNDVKTLQSTINSRNDELRRATDSRTKLLEEQLRINNEMQDIKQAKETLEGLYDKEKVIAETIQKQEERLADYRKQLDGAVKNLERVKQDFRQKQETDRKTIREHSKDLDKLNSIQAEVEHCLSRNIEEKLRAIEEQLESAERMAVKFKNERIAHETRLSKMREDVRFHDTAKRNLTDNLTLRRLEIQAKTLKDECQALMEKLTATNYATISKDREKLCKNRDDTERERNRAQGTEEELAKYIADLTLELQKKDNLRAHDNYKNKCAELVICHRSVDDLHMYSKALDTAMIEYHEERMNTINKIMKKLWDLIYTGSDTSSIQIRTEATTNSSADTRRQFNYKLVQIKHGVEMDMKGRCSAGQKVLASIILRLALAETFCEKCGVLALDEPTTNLDEENSKSLADALHKYVNLRKSERNFQLIIITHDEYFISALGQLSSNNSYYELFRYPSGLSGIKKVSLDGLLHRGDDESSEEDNKDNVLSSVESKRDKIASVDSSGPRDKRPSKKHNFE